jgi:light-harvesting complex 1 beta chain
MAHEHTERAHAAHGSPLEGFHVIFIAIFLAFLMLALVSQLLTWNWRTWLPGAEGARSVWSGVQAAVYTVISQLT